MELLRLSCKRNQYTIKFEIEDYEEELLVMIRVIVITFFGVRCWRIFGETLAEFGCSRSLRGVK